MSPEARLIAQARELKPGKPPSRVTLSWEAFVALVKERDKAREDTRAAREITARLDVDCAGLADKLRAAERERDAALALADDRERDLEPYEEEIDTLRKERDEARSRLERLAHYLAARSGWTTRDVEEAIAADVCPLTPLPSPTR